MGTIYGGQIQAIVLSLMLGTVLGIIYDCFFVLGVILGVKKIKLKFKKLDAYVSCEKKPKKGASFVESILDIAFCIVITPICAISLFVINSGVVRWYIVLGVFVGLMIYKLTLSVLILQVISSTIFSFKAVLKFMLKKLKNQALKVKHKIEKVGQDLPH